MVIYFFQGGAEVLKFKIDRINKTLKVASSLTAYRWRPLPYSELYENQEEQAEIEVLNNSDFDERLKIAVAKKHGYVFIKKVDR